MKTNVVFFYNEDIRKDHLSYFEKLNNGLSKYDYEILIDHDYENMLDLLLSNTRIVGVIFDWEHCPIELLKDLAEHKPNLPLFAVSHRKFDIDLDLESFSLNLDFLQFDIGIVDQGVHRILQNIQEYIDTIMPPFTKRLMSFVNKNDYVFSTPGHQAGLGFQKTPVGTFFYDFFGPNIFRSDISISMSELGSLLEHSGPHRDAEEFIAETFNADRSYIVTNGTSTSNKIVGMSIITDGDTILIDRNCHKSLAQLMMMVDAYPIYLKPTRNRYGIIGGIPASEFEHDNIQKKINAHPGASKLPKYMVVTNSTYDGILYNVEKLVSSSNIQHIHFDSAWVPYTNFHPIYAKKYGMYVKAQQNKIIYSTQSTHKLLAAFSQGSMIHIKGKHDESRFNESFMMHTTTSPFYPLVASCEVSAAMMRGKVGFHAINDAITLAIDFREEIARLDKESGDSWFYRVWQPDDITAIDAWPLEPNAKWHGFKNIDEQHLYLDPLKVTLLLPGMTDDGMSDWGIPASIVAAYLEDHGIVVEKTGPYTLLFLFSLGVTRAKSMRLLAILNKFKQRYDENKKIKEILPSIYNENPMFYKNMRIQELAKKQHELLRSNNLPNLLYHAFEKLPQFVITPHKAYQHLVRNEIETVKIADMLGKTSAVMVLPYPPGIPLLIPGEAITEDTKEILDYLLLLEKISSHFPGFEIEVHGLEMKDDGHYYIQVLNI